MGSEKVNLISGGPEQCMSDQLQLAVEGDVNNLMKLRVSAEAELERLEPQVANLRTLIARIDQMLPRPEEVTSPQYIP